MVLRETPEAITVSDGSREAKVNRSTEVESIGLLDIWNDVWSHRWFLISNATIWVVAALLYVSTASDEYTAYASIVLTPSRITGSSQNSNAGNAVVQLDSIQAESQIQVLKSERSLRTVFDVYKDEFIPAEARSTTSFNFSGLLRSLISGKGSAPNSIDLEDRFFQRFADKASVRRVGASYVLELAYRAPSAVLAARIANSIVSQYLFNQIDLKAASIEKGGEFLQNRISDIQQQRVTAKESVQNGKIPPRVLPDADAQIISAATVPLKKSWPLSGLTVLFALAMSTAFGLTIIVVRNTLHPVIKSLRSMKRDMEFSCITAVKKNADAFMRPSHGSLLKRLSLLDHPGRASLSYANSLKTIRENILAGCSDMRPFLTCFLPLHPGSEHATLALATAYTLASSGKKVLLVDFDINSAALTLLVWPNAIAGFYDCESTAELEQLAGSCKVADGLYFVPARSPTKIFNPNYYVFSKEHLQMLRDVKDIDVVVVFLSPSSSAVEAHNVGLTFDNATVTAKSGLTPALLLRDTVVALKAPRSIPAAGVLFN
ncbi:Chain length determinant protein [Methylobacterium sp. 190mf]|uniref:Wzz/FepE/Etk N-terminal domain-containing protein n=1 Tax=Methylobacterium sp. 190mf TaxID=1761798 RepID=UPI00089F54C7|nr:Wzz/FepE/Etk N-terminal domain-containing protein [Methylobacterium sp. 190mf]SEG71215.1 Chain length determinant protein [Methylobacterium sp. 190mf]